MPDMIVTPAGKIQPMTPEVSSALSVDKASIVITTTMKSTITKEQLIAQVNSLQARLDDVNAKAKAQVDSVQAQLDKVNAQLALFA